MEQEEFTTLMKDLIKYLEHTNILTILSDEATINDELNTLFINCEKYDEEKRNKK